MRPGPRGRAAMERVGTVQNNSCLRPGRTTEELGVSLEDANWNTSVVMVALWVSRIKTVRVVTMRRVVVIRA